MCELTSDKVFSSFRIDACCNRADIVGNEWQGDKGGADNINAKWRAKHGTVDGLTTLLKFWVSKNRFID